jgi:hypothetical protein
MVVKPLAGFGVLDCGYSVKNSGGYEFSELNTICLTPTGKGLLQTL